MFFMCGSEYSFPKNASLFHSFQIVQIWQVEISPPLCSYLQHSKKFPAFQDSKPAFNITLLYL